MTIDKEKLKALAEASRPGEWYSAGDLRYCDDKTGEIHGLHHDDNRFIAAVSPTAILALLAEIERLTEERDSQQRVCIHVMEQRDQLKAENEALRKDAERYRWLRDQNPNAFHLERNTGNSVNYCTVAQWIEDNPEWFDGTPDGDLEKMAQTNSHWQIQIYPDTPIGFYVTSRATLDEVIDAVIAEESSR